MLFLVRPDGASLLLDPTIGLVADASFDDVASGTRGPAGRIVLFGTREDLEDFERTVTTALVEGKLRPSGLLYYFDGIDHLMNHIGEWFSWPTPSARAFCSRKGPATPIPETDVDDH
jgi:hypothetical protein